MLCVRTVVPDAGRTEYHMTLRSGGKRGRERRGKTRGGHVAVVVVVYHVAMVVVVVFVVTAVAASVVVGT